MVNKDKSASKPRSVYEEIFSRFDTLVEEQRLYLNYNLSREDYMELMQVDKNLFGRILKDCAGTNLNGYLNARRLRYAVYLLEHEPALSLAEVADRCAIPSSSTFFRLFKEHYGMSPNDYRQQMGGHG